MPTVTNDTLKHLMCLVKFGADCTQTPFTHDWDVETDGAQGDLI